MKYYTSKVLIAFFFSLAANCLGQNSRLEIIFRNDEDSICNNIYLVAASDTIRNINSTKSTIEIDSLSPGPYKLIIKDCNEKKEQSLTRDILLDSNTVIEIAYDIYITEFDEEKNKDSIVKNRLESQATMSYFNRAWAQNPYATVQNIYFASTSSSWSTFSKHFGFLIGGGIGFGYHSVSGDTTFANQPTLKKRFEYYTYLNGHVEMRLRFTGGNQQKSYPDIKLKMPGKRIYYSARPKFILDAGATYYFPIIFNHVVRYEDNYKLRHKWIHQYTDARAFVNIGYASVVLFCEYRLFNFILGNYPELPTYNVGLRILFID